MKNYAALPRGVKFLMNAGTARAPLRDVTNDVHVTVEPAPETPIPGEIIHPSTGQPIERGRMARVESKLSQYPSLLSIGAFTCTVVMLFLSIGNYWIAGSREGADNAAQIKAVREAVKAEMDAQTDNFKARQTEMQKSIDKMEERIEKMADRSDRTLDLIGQMKLEQTEARTKADLLMKQEGMK